MCAPAPLTGPSTRSRPRGSDPEPAVYKTAALPIELGRRRFRWYLRIPDERAHGCSRFLHGSSRLGLFSAGDASVDASEGAWDPWGVFAGKLPLTTFCRRAGVFSQPPP